ncbi:universal stress protein [Desulfofustis glycolicus]|uniref:Nucleotide-binding universal stress protein, UspA family n=1 Tax=Desulfofustis glycolicus DSM 9705 TaxID=1121409 RepID=A0A1M5W2Y6_9BACT|nr:universal stress protein [Desulfofustis glycolicus]MCB2215095.1 universal stress protein [Desulfobulbaceae bacterium]SHH81564.1 Nucleotide-binding universal stress protein, UspA family [Desulfofustis glycolicus DSM 9705]
MSIKKIMVPLTFSRFSQRMLDYSATLAEALDAELILVNVINERDLAAVDKISSFGFKVDSEHYVETVKKERREAIADMASKLSLADDRVSFVFLIGDPSTELLRFVVESNVDLVVMGIKTRDLQHIFAGSVAERMFRRCPVPVVSYRGGDTTEQMTQWVRKHITHT